MVKYLKVLLSSVLLLSFCLVLPGLIYAQSSLGPGVDLIVLIDQSNSMFGLGATEERDAIPGTDREGRRIDTAQYLIDYMAFDNVYVNPNRTNRVLVIAFGSYGRDKVVVPLTNLTSEQASQKAKDLLEPLRSSRESLNGTDFISAFEEISEHFSASAGDAVDPDANGLRNRLVVVITDGGPDIRGTRFDSNEEYFRYLGETYHVMLGEDYPVYVIGVDQSEPPLYWNEVVDLWEDNVTGAGNAVQVSDPREIKKQVVQMFCPFLNPTSTGEECRLQDIVIGHIV